MKPRKIPMRKDIVTGEMVPKKELVRIVRTPEGNVILDPSNRANGRGAYISLSVDVAETAKKKRIFDKVFETKLEEQFYDELIAYVDHQAAGKELFGDAK